MRSSPTFTSTFFDGTGKCNGKAYFGYSKEKRTDCPLVTLGLVVDAVVFPKRSDIFDGNVSKAGTLEEMKERRVDGHLFITVLAYLVLQTIRFKLRKRGMTKNWSTLHKGLSTHMRITTTMKRGDGKMIHIRKSSWPETFHVQIYDALNIPQTTRKTIKIVL